jgi:hypothetical protein
MSLKVYCKPVFQTMYLLWIKTDEADVASNHSIKMILSGLYTTLTKANISLPNISQPGDPLHRYHSEKKLND